MLAGRGGCAGSRTAVVLETFSQLRARCATIAVCGVALGGDRPRAELAGPGGAVDGLTPLPLAPTDKARRSPDAGQGQGQHGASAVHREGVPPPSFPPASLRPASPQLPAAPLPPPSDPSGSVSGSDMQALRSSGRVPAALRVGPGCSRGRMVRRGKANGVLQRRFCGERAGRAWRCACSRREPYSYSKFPPF